MQQKLLWSTSDGAVPNQQQEDGVACNRSFPLEFVARTRPRGKSAVPVRKVESPCCPFLLTSHLQLRPHPFMTYLHNICPRSAPPHRILRPFSYCSGQVVASHCACCTGLVVPSDAAVNAVLVACILILLIGELFHVSARATNRSSYMYLVLASWIFPLLIHSCSISTARLII